MKFKATDNQQLRARLMAIKKLMPLYPELVKYLRHGAIPPECREDFEILENKAFQEMSENKVDNTSPLSFVELCSFGTWFQIHPEKVAGKEILTTSKGFPVSIRGTKENIIQTIQKGIGVKQAKPTIKREATLIVSESKERGYNIKMLDGKAFQDFSDVFGWFRTKKEGVEEIKAFGLKYVATHSEPPYKGKVVFSFSASNIIVNKYQSNDILELERHDGKTLMRLLDKYPNFMDRLNMYHRLTNYYKNIPLKTRLRFFKDDPRNTPNFPGTQVLEFSDQKELSQYIDAFGDRKKMPLSKQVIHLQSGEEYFWINKHEWEKSTRGNVKIKYEKQDDTETRLRLTKAKAIAKLKILTLLKI